MTQFLSGLIALGLLGVGVGTYLEKIPATLPVICSVISFSGLGIILMLDAIRSAIKNTGQY